MPCGAWLVMAGRTLGHVFRRYRPVHTTQELTRLDKNSLQQRALLCRSEHAPTADLAVQREV